MSDTIETRPLIIIGSGPAGYTAALYAARANLRPLVIDGGPGQGQTLTGQGGQLTITTEIENYPGFEEGIMGPELMIRMRKQVARFGTEFVEDLVTELDLLQRPFRVSVGRDDYRADLLVLAMGASARWLGLDEEKPVWEGGLGGAGVSACATCDGALPVFRNKELAVVGGGDTAAEEALYLTHFASKVYIIHRRNELRASQIMRKRVSEHPKIEMAWNKVVTRIHDVAEKHVTGLDLRDTVTGAESHLPVAGMFVAIGHKPNSDLVAGKVDLNEAGYVVTHHNVRTSMRGVFACGDLQDHEYRQAVTAAGSGCMAAIQAERYLAAESAGATPEW
jgi:thioredoxin reductase (NADPH)